MTETILVVGAGLAGLAAAQELVQAGRRVMVLEARSRLGGRIWTDHLGGVPLELGAAWLHDSPHHPLLPLAQRVNLTLVATEPAQWTLFTGSGRRLDADQARAWIAARSDLLQALAVGAASWPPGGPAPTVAAAWKQALAVCRPPPAERARWRWHLALLALIEGADPRELSLEHLAVATPAGGEDRLVVGGFTRLLDALATGLDVHLNQPVQAITVSRDHVTVTTRQEAYQADRVLVTLPLGVLQAGTVAFSPPLPPAKQAAIARLGMGTLLKVVLHFVRPFWPAEPAAFAAVFPRLPPFSYVLNGLHVQSAPLLIAFVGGARAQALERQGDRAVVATARRSLQRLFGRPIPPPDDVRVTRWSSDPFARGAYSYLAVGATLDDYDRLAEPVGQRLFFAGEHTDRACPAILAGAFLSGQREAARLLAFP